MSEPTADGLGLLLAMMEPPASLETEFQDWYDREHVPEREVIPGFLNATRLVCLDGWPRYLAVYDLDDVGVLAGPDYARIAGDNYSRWTGRVIGQVWGWYRLEAGQIAPGGARLGDAGAFSRLALWRFRGVPAEAASAVACGLETIYAGRPETAQVRLFGGTGTGAGDLVGLVELHAPFTPPPGAAGAFGPALRHLDMVNTYARYTRG